MAKFARYPDRIVLYIAPTYRQAKQICWDQIKLKLDSLNWVKSTNESELKITLINGTKILLRSADAGESIRGIGADFVVLDEVQDIPAEIFNEVIRPALADRRGHALLIGTPKGRGNFLYHVFERAQHLDDWASYQFTTLEGGIVCAEEIASARAEMDARTFRQEFEAKFETYQGAVYYSYGTHNIANMQDADTRLLYVGMDFNVDPMSAVVCVPTGTGLHIIDEIVIYGSNTQEMADEIKTRYPRSRIWAFPDPAGKARKTSSSTTDHAILRNNGFVVKARTSHPSVRNRVNSVNSLLQTADGTSRVTIEPHLKRVHEALTKQSYKEGTQIPDKTQGYDHITDALGYCVEFNWPLVTEIETTNEPAYYRVGLAV